MKQNQIKTLMQQQIFESPHQQSMLTPPNPPTKQMIERAKFIDKTFVWKTK